MNSAYHYRTNCGDSGTNAEQYPCGRASRIPTGFDLNFESVATFRKKEGARGSDVRARNAHQPLSIGDQTTRERAESFPGVSGAPNRANRPAPCVDFCRLSEILNHRSLPHSCEADMDRLVAWIKWHADDRIRFRLLRGLNFDILVRSTRPGWSVGFRRGYVLIVVIIGNFDSACGGWWLPICRSKCQAINAGDLGPVNADTFSIVATQCDVVFWNDLKRLPSVKCSVTAPNLDGAITGNCR